MAKMIDQLPEYIGEQMVWHAFSDNLPNHYIVYNSRTIQGDEYDFCILVENMGIFIVEVKGWFPENVINVVSPKSIYIEGYSKALGSPLNQARSYMFNMINHLQDDMGINPLLMSMVCYPRISKEEYYKKKLNTVSDEIETIFAEDLQNPQVLLSKFKAKYKNDAVKHADVLDHKMYMLIRHDFEPNFDLKEKAEELNPSYSRLRIIVNSLSAEQIQEIKDEYFTGIKEIVFFNDKDNYEELIKNVDEEFRQRNLKAERGNIVIGTNSLNISSGSEYSIFNFSAYYIENLAEYSPQNELVEEGQLSETQKAILQKVSEVCTFNYQQFLIEHADTDKDILVTAGAGTGKTYSMVSRVAYLCNKVADPIVDISKDLAMITFTNDAADNMKDRLKQMFMNYFTLTNKERYLHLIDEMNQIQISTIHKFAFEILRKSCITFGIGNDFEISSETYKRRSIYQHKLNEFIARKIDADPYFINQLPLKVYELEDILLTFTAQLYNKSIDVKKITEENLGAPIEIMPFFNELIMECVVPAEEEYYQLLLDENKIDLQQAMILLNNLVNDSSFENHGLEFRYVFVDEFQDTDDVQIDSVIGLQKLFGKNCRLFVVGDLKQSIYRFRGATLSAFDKVKNNHRTWIELPLMRNYRTDERLLDNFHPVFAAMGNMGLLPYEAADRLSSNIQTDCPSDILIIKIESDIKKPDLYYEDLFRAIKQQYDYLVEKNKEVKLSDKENTIAILVRYNYQTETIVREAKKGISMLR